MSLNNLWTTGISLVIKYFTVIKLSLLYQWAKDRQSFSPLAIEDCLFLIFILNSSIQKICPDLFSKTAGMGIFTF